MKHIHHILPKYMGGTDDPENLIEVTVEQHAELHFAAYLKHGRWQDWYAAMGLAGIIGKEEIVKAQQVYGGTISTKNRRSYDGEGNPFYGRQHKEETKQKLREAALKQHSETPHPWTGRKHSEETKEKFKKRIPWNKGKKMTDEHKKAISEGRRRK